MRIDHTQSFICTILWFQQQDLHRIAALFQSLHATCSTRWKTTMLVHYPQNFNAPWNSPHKSKYSLTGAEKQYAGWLRQAKRPLEGSEVRPVRWLSTSPGLSACRRTPHHQRRKIFSGHQNPATPANTRHKAASSMNAIQDKTIHCSCNDANNTKVTIQDKTIHCP